MTTRLLRLINAFLLKRRTVDRAIRGLNGAVATLEKTKKLQEEEAARQLSIALAATNKESAAREQALRADRIIGKVTDLLS